MTHTLGYLDMSRSNIREYHDLASVVTVDNVCLGRRVTRGRHWSAKWRDDVADGSTTGHVVGYVDGTGLVGENAPRQYNQAQQGQPSWCVVQWEDGRRSVYPIGAEGIYALAFCD